MTTAAGVYARLSPVPKDKQHLDDVGASLGGGRQQADGAALAEARRWTVAERYTDDDKSAFSGKLRPAYDRMVADLRSGAINAVIAWHPDRLHRTPRELEDFIDLIETTGAQVATCTAGDIDLSTPDGRALARIACVIARKESEDKSRRLRRKHKQLAELGQLSGGGRRPFGYEVNRITIRETEADEIRDAARRILAGESLRGITHDWRGRGIHTVTGALWSPTTIRRLMCSGRISGQREHRDPDEAKPGKPAQLRIVGPAVWPAIITPEDTARLRAVLGGHGPGQGNARSYLLTGFVMCADCEQFMTARAAIRKGNRYRRYHCAKDRGGCDRVGISAARLEEMVTEMALEILDSPTLAELAHAGDADADVAAIELVAELEATLEQLARDHYGDKVITRPEYLAARSMIEPRLADAREAVARRRPVDVLDGVPTGAGELAAAWHGDKFTLARKRAILATVLEYVKVAPTTRANNRFDPSRIVPAGGGEVRWRI